MGGLHLPAPSRGSNWDSKNRRASSGWVFIYPSLPPPNQDPSSSVRGLLPGAPEAPGQGRGAPAGCRGGRSAGRGRGGSGGGGPFSGTYLRAVAAAAGIGRHRPAPALIGGGGRGALCKCRGGPPRSTARRTAAEVSAGTGGCGHGGNLGNRVHACPSSPCVGNWEPEPRNCCLRGGLCSSRLLLCGGQVGKGSCMKGWKKWGYTFLSWVMDRVDAAVCSPDLHGCWATGVPACSGDRTQSEMGVTSPSARGTKGTGPLCPHLAGGHT